MVLPFPKLLRNFYLHQKGAAGIEFLLSLPVILFVFAILHDVGRMITMKSRVVDAAATIADVLSQRTSEKELAIDWNDGPFGGKVGQQWLLMGEVLMFPERTPNPIYSYYDTHAPIGVEVRASGTDGKFLCYHNRRGLVIPDNEMGWQPGSAQPEVVVGVALRFSLPLLSGPFGMGLMSPTMVFHAVERRRMRSVLVADKTHAVSIRPLYLEGPASVGRQSDNPLCNPPN